MSFLHQKRIDIFCLPIQQFQQMQSIAPHIIKHFIPYQFSKNVLDQQVVPKKVSAQKDQNPLQNIKLRNLERQAQKQLVLTYKNKSNALYRSKKSINYHHLFRELDQQHQKLSLIKKHLKESQRNDSVKIKEQSQIRTSKGTINQLIFDEKDFVEDKRYHSYRKLHFDQANKRINLSSRGKTAVEGKRRPLTHHLYSSINFKQYNQRIIAEYSKNSQQPSNHNNTGISSVKLKIRGRHAPNRQMIDHLKRSTTSSSDLIISINKFDKK